MKIENVPFTNIDWSSVPAIKTKGDTGTATSKEVMLGDLRLRLIDFSPGYSADHWCDKGHVVTVLEGSITTTLDNGQIHTTDAGNSFVVSDETAAHRSATVTGARVLIVD